ncbi:MAG: LPS export ABC transporter periplasmic protein LptC [Pseudomonadota bacterium]
MTQTTPIHHVPKVSVADTAAADEMLGFISTERDSGEYQKAVSHSNRVRILKVLLPVVGVIIILVIASMFVLQKMFVPDLEIKSITMQDGKLVMNNPELNGLDGEYRPYKLKADKAIQDADNPRRVELIDITATLPMSASVSADIVAGNGIYDADQKTLLLTQRVNVETSDGMLIELKDADVDIGNGVLVTNNPIFATSAKADIVSSTMVIKDRGKHLLFEGNVNMTLRPKELKEDEADEDNAEQ